MSALFASRRRHVNDCAAGRVIALRLIRPTADLCSCTATYQGAYRYRSRLSNRYIVFTSAHQVTDMQYRSNTTLHHFINPALHTMQAVPITTQFQNCDIISKVMAIDHTSKRQQLQNSRQSK